MFPFVDYFVSSSTSFRRLPDIIGCISAENTFGRGVTGNRCSLAVLYAGLTLYILKFIVSSPFGSRCGNGINYCVRFWTFRVRGFPVSLAFAIDTVCIWYFRRHSGDPWHRTVVTFRMYISEGYALACTRAHACQAFWSAKSSYALSRG